MPDWRLLKLANSFQSKEKTDASDSSSFSNASYVDPNEEPNKIEEKPLEEDKEIGNMNPS